MPVKSADEFYSIMCVLTREMLEFGLMDANCLIKVNIWYIKCLYSIVISAFFEGWKYIGLIYFDARTIFFIYTYLRLYIIFHVRLYRVSNYRSWPNCVKDTFIISHHGPRWLEMVCDYSTATMKSMTATRREMMRKDLMELMAF